MHQLSFRVRHDYGRSTGGIEIPLTLQVGNKAVRLTAKLDSGAEFCIFQREYAEMLGLQVEDGTPQRMASVGGTFLTYGHPVVLWSLGIEIETTAYFTEQHEFSRNVLGRHGWIQQTRLGLIDYDGHLFASKYDE